METNIAELILKYNEGLADPSEIRQLELLIEDGKVALTELRSLAALEDQLFKTEAPGPSLSLDDKFYKMLSAAKKDAKPVINFSIRWPELSRLLPRLALAASLLVVAFIGGYWFNRPVADPAVSALSKQVGDLKEMVMLSLLEKESASERLRAVSLTSEMDQASKKVTAALLQTLNHDNNVNVRLAALDALRPYVKDNSVRTELVKAIASQDSPLVQIGLAELMAQIQEKGSLREFNKILKGDKTPQEVKNRIKEKLQILI